MRPIDKQLARAILCEVESVFGAERAVLLSKNRKFNDARYAAMELFPWSTQTTAAYFGVTVNSVSWARSEVQKWSDVYPDLKSKLETVRSRLKLPSFPRHERHLSKKTRKLLDFSLAFTPADEH